MLRNRKPLLLALAVSAALTGCNKETVVEVNPLEEPLDLIVVLGLQVNYESCTPRNLMEYRVDRAFEIYSELENPLIIAAGKGNPTTEGTCAADGKTEAAATQQILMEKYGVPSSRIILEEYSTTTTTNATEVKRIVDALESTGAEFQTMQLVSSHYHIHRQNGADAMASFNDVFGDETFTPDNSYTSSAFGTDEFWTTDFTLLNGWRPDNSAIHLGDVVGNGKADIIAFKDQEIYVALSTGKSFEEKQVWSSDFALR